MICNKCENKIENDSKFCEFCGEKVQSIDQISSPKMNKRLFSKKTFYFWIFFISTSLLIIAVFLGSEKWDTEDFYAFLRLFIFCVSLYFILKKWNEKNINSVFPFIITAIIFNPFLPFHFDGDALNMIKFFATGLFGYFSYKEFQKL